MTRTLGQLKLWLDEAEEYATAREFDAESLLSQRLYIDMFPLTRQIQSACDSAKFAGSRLAGAEPPVDPDEETTLEQLRGRIDKTIAFLEGLDPAAFDGDPEREIRLPFLPEGKASTAAGYFRGFALPNFYFHATMAYAILRSNGVKLGKRRFIGPMPIHDV